MVNLIKSGTEPNNVDRYSTLIHQILDDKDESDPDFKKLSIETCHTAKFICQLDDTIEIVRKMEKPDFLIRYQDRSIGLEHEILVKQESKQKEGSISDLVRGLEEEFRINHPEKKLLLTVFPHPYLKFRKAEKPRISREVMILIENFINDNKLPENGFIDRLTVMPHSRLDFSCNLGGWCQSNLDENNLNTAIIKKEVKISGYKRNSGTTEQWLLIVIGGLGESSYEIETLDAFRNKTETKFDRVYLLEDFRANLYEVL
jgi:hypothetical protein